MPAQVIDGRALAETIHAAVRAEAAALTAAGRPPCLATVRIGDNAAAQSYARAQARAAEAAGIRLQSVQLPDSATQHEAAIVIAGLNAEPTVHAVLLHMPVPRGIDPFLLQAAIAPAKDVEGVTPANMGLLVMGQPALVPCTAAAAFECIRATEVDLAGREAVVVGRSNIVGKPIGALLLAAHATVTFCHSRTRDLAVQTRRAEVLVAAVGRPGLIGREHVKPGAVVIDVGTNQVADGTPAGRIVGDVRYDEVVPVAGWITPVPGGVGPVTVATLLRNVVQAARRAI